MSLPHGHGLAMPGLRLNPRLLPTFASASGRGLQAESADGDDLALHCLRLPRFHEERDYGQAASSHFYPTHLSLGVAGVAHFLLGLPQYAVVSLRLVTVAQDVILRALSHPVSLH